ncbi:MAG: hypothetical protein M0R17_01050 [Candidatus Omnitrophica bacterium]|jgi:hypothetical protein|nr:hypothetical protein [Candidatus Omnitrophota bacterium]
MLKDSYIKLKELYPKTYEKDIVCGFWAPDEWFDILNRLSEKIENYLIAHPGIEFQVMQVKEKFGGLRFYVNIVINEINQYIEEAEIEVYELQKAKAPPRPIIENKLKIVKKWESFLPNIPFINEPPKER